MSDVNSGAPPGRERRPPGSPAAATIDTRPAAKRANPHEAGRPYCTAGAGYRRAGAQGHVQPPIAVIETFRPHDDVIVMFTYDQDVVDFVRGLPAWARAFDRGARVWRIHPGFADDLAVVLGWLGFEVRHHSPKAAGAAA